MLRNRKGEIDMEYTVNPVSKYRSKKRIPAAIIMIVCFGLGTILFIIRYLKDHMQVPSMIRMPVSKKSVK